MLFNQFIGKGIQHRVSVGEVLLPFVPFLAIGLQLLGGDIHHLLALGKQVLHVVQQTTTEHRVFEEREIKGFSQLAKFV